MKVITSDEGLTVHWHNKSWAVVRTYGFLTGTLYQLYRRVDERTWERYPVNGIQLYKTIKAAREHALLMSEAGDAK